jgi:mono/diheme cytochrome c family protein
MRRVAIGLGIVFSMAACARHGAHPAATASAAPTTLSASASRGETLYDAQCAICHSPNAPGAQIGVSLAGEGHKRTFAQIVAAIDDPSPPMPKLTLSRQDEDDLAAYVEQL